MAVHVFLYDDACPMCSFYTDAFCRLGLSERSGFSHLDPSVVPQLDLQRGRHEIPLINTTTGEVRYGLDAMTLGLANL